MGLTISDAFRLLMVRVAKEKALPFEPLTPNAVTVRAMKEARRGKVKSFKSVDDCTVCLHLESPKSPKNTT